MTERSTSTSRTLPCGRPLPRPAESHASDSETLPEVLKRLEAYTSAHELNHSEAREKILETIVLEARHFTATSLLAHLKKRHPEVGKATLYRNLPILIQSGIIQEGPQDPSGQALYELADDHHHDHIVCLDCQRIFEFHDDSIEQKQDVLCDKRGFEVKSHRHVIYASCKYRKN
jgi:Fur family ferric uptake transcriptional regulator